MIEVHLDGSFNMSRAGAAQFRSSSRRLRAHDLERGPDRQLRTGQLHRRQARLVALSAPSRSTCSASTSARTASHRSRAGHGQHHSPRPKPPTGAVARCRADDARADRPDGGRSWADARRGIFGQMFGRCARTRSCSSANRARFGRFIAVTAGRPTRSRNSSRARSVRRSRHSSAPTDVFSWVPGVKLS